MKKAATIVLIGLLLFNWYGYRLITSFIEGTANAALNARLDDNDYNEEQLLSIKIPANLPYYINSVNFERIDGQIEIAGIHYNYVKRRVFRDSLEYMCIPNVQKMRIASASVEFFKSVNDLSQSQKKSGDHSLTKSPVTDLYQPGSTWECITFYTLLVQNPQVFILVLPDPVYAPGEMPPDTARRV